MGKQEKKDTTVAKTMTVRFREGVAGTYWSYRPGEQATVPIAEARIYIKNGTAEPVGRSPDETATLAGPTRKNG